MIIVQDTREQRPYHFPGDEVAVRTLHTGDYSIEGYEDRICIERKSLQDAYQSLGRERARFEREMQRMARIDYAAVVIEATLQEFLRGPAFTRMHPKAAVASILGWSVKYGIHVFFAGDRTHGNALTRELLRKFYRYFTEDTYDAQAASTNTRS